MAITVIDPTDSIGEVVNSVNTISGDVGDIANISSSNVVDEINTYYNGLLRLNDSSEQIAITKQAYSITDAGGDGGLTYNSTSGTFEFTGASAAQARARITAHSGVQFVAGGMSLDSGTILNRQLASESITSSKYTGVVTTLIKNSAGTTILTLRTPEV